MNGADRMPARSAFALMAASSLLIPVAGLVTAPILARALDPVGRGELAAALAPAVLLLATATFGLPEALTYKLAKRPELSGAALLLAGAMTLALGGVLLGVNVALLPFLSAGDPALARLILVASILTVPGLLVNVLRGVAEGNQRWGAAAAEKAANSGLKVVTFVVLFVLHDLTVLVAVVVSTVTVLVAGCVYLPLLRELWRARRRAAGAAPDRPGPAALSRELLSFGWQQWFGSVASMLLARSGALLMVPLSSAFDLGLYTVATTIADVPLVVAVAIQSTLFGLSSRSMDAGRVTEVGRLGLLAAALGCTVIAASLPWWIGPVFGSGFEAATIPTVLALLASVVGIPGLIAATGLAAWGRPAVRSVGLTLTLVVSVVGFVALVPSFGVYGACIASLVANTVMTAYMVIAARAVLKVDARDFVAVRGSDVTRLASVGKAGLRRLSSGRGRGR